MNSLIQKTRTPYGAIIAASFFLVLILGIITATRAQAVSSVPTAGKRLITIHDDGQDKGVLTRATTMRQALAEAKINLDANDTVEPGLDDELVGNNYEANIYRARPVTIIDGSIRTKVMSPYRTASQITKQAGMTLHDEDNTKIDANTDLVAEGSGVSLTIDRATPVTLVLYGKQTQAFTQATTVNEMLKEKKITLAADDTLSVDQSTSIKSGMIIELWRNGKQTQTIEEEIPFETEKIQDSAREVGYKEVKTPGENGKKTVTYEVIMKNGQEQSRILIQSVETKKAVKQVEIVGSKYKGAYTTPSQNQGIAWAFFIAKGFTREQTAGIMGNLQKEHGFNTTGDGLAQWTGSRKAQLMSRPDPYNINTQLEFLMHELDTGYIKVQNNLRASTTVESAVTIFQNQYEKCGVCMESQRIQSAYNFLATF